MLRSTTNPTTSPIRVPNPLISILKADIIAFTEVAVNVAKVVRPTPNNAIPAPTAVAAIPRANIAALNPNIGTIAGLNNNAAPANTAIPPPMPTNPLIIEPQDILENINIGGINAFKATAINRIPAAPIIAPDTIEPAAPTAINATAIPPRPLANSSHDILPIIVTGIMSADRAIEIASIPAPAASILGPPANLENSAISPNINPIVTSPLVNPATSICEMLSIADTMILIAAAVPISPKAVPGPILAPSTTLKKIANSANITPKAITDLAIPEVFICDRTSTADARILTDVANAISCSELVFILPP